MFEFEAEFWVRRRLRHPDRRCLPISASIARRAEGARPPRRRIKAELDDARRLKDEAQALVAEYQAPSAKAPRRKPRRSSPTPRRKPSVSRPKPRAAWRISSRAAPRWPRTRSPRPKRRRSPMCAPPPPTPPCRPHPASCPQTVKGTVADDLLNQGHRRNSPEAQLSFFRRPQTKKPASRRLFLLACRARICHEQDFNSSHRNCRPRREPARDFAEFAQPPNEKTKPHGVLDARFRGHDGEWIMASSDPNRIANRANPCATPTFCRAIRAAGRGARLRDRSRYR